MTNHSNTSERISQLISLVHELVMSLHELISVAQQSVTMPWKILLSPCALVSYYSPDLFASELNLHTYRKLPFWPYGCID